MRGTCRLCLQEAELRDSHIVPEFLHRDLYNEKHQVLGIHGRGATGAKRLQKGLREHLLCEGCEQHFNERFEKPFRRRWIEENALSGPWPLGETRIVRVDYASFKLFHLSVFFRADVCSRRTYSFISLGSRHRDRIRRMLLDLDPGRPTEYPIKAAVPIHHETKAPMQMVSHTERVRLDGHTFYGMMYGGASWWMRASSQSFPGVDQDHLLANGDLPLVAKDWRQFPVIQAAGMALRGELAF